jgi:hypothetical protein
MASLKTQDLSQLKLQLKQDRTLRDGLLSQMKDLEQRISFIDAEVQRRESMENLFVDLWNFLDELLQEGSFSEVSTGLIKQYQVEYFEQATQTWRRFSRSEVPWFLRFNAVSMIRVSMVPADELKPVWNRLWAAVREDGDMPNLT